VKTRGPPADITKQRIPTAYNIKYADTFYKEFREIAHVMGVVFPDGLVRLVNQFMECHKLTTQFTANGTILINLFNSTNNYTHSQNLNIKSPNFTLTSLIHWKVLTVLISHLTVDQQNWIKSFEENKDHNGILLGPLASNCQAPSILLILISI